MEILTSLALYSIHISMSNNSGEAFFGANSCLADDLDQFLAGVESHEEEGARWPKVSVTDANAQDILAKLQDRRANMGELVCNWQSCFSACLADVNTRTNTVEIKSTAFAAENCQKRA
jgi:hypothetical protein